MLEYLIDGGPLMLPLVLCSIVAVTVIIDRARAFRLADTDTPRAVRRGIFFWIGVALEARNT